MARHREGEVAEVVAAAVGKAPHMARHSLEVVVGKAPRRRGTMVLEPKVSNSNAECHHSYRGTQCLLDDCQGLRHPFHGVLRIHVSPHFNADAAQNITNNGGLHGHGEPQGRKDGKELHVERLLCTYLGRLSDRERSSEAQDRMMQESMLQSWGGMGPYIRDIET
jgi:hypothetical protein